MPCTVGCFLFTGRTTPAKWLLTRLAKRRPTIVLESELAPTTAIACGCKNRVQRGRGCVRPVPQLGIEILVSTGADALEGVNPHPAVHTHRLLRGPGLVSPTCPIPDPEPPSTHPVSQLRQRLYDERHSA